MCFITAGPITRWSPTGKILIHPDGPVCVGVCVGVCFITAGPVCVYYCSPLQSCVKLFACLFFKDTEPSPLRHGFFSLVSLTQRKAALRRSVFADDRHVGPRAKRTDAHGDVLLDGQGSGGAPVRRVGLRMCLPGHASSAGRQV